MNKETSLILPEHIAFIMDGNGRWAVKKGLQRSAGHKAGAEALDKMISYTYSIGIKNITFYAFSTENWSRPADEVAALMSILTKWLSIMIKRFNENAGEVYKNTKVNFIGDTGALSLLQRKKIADIEKKSIETENRMTLNLAVNYGARAEITRAVNKFITENPGKKISENDISRNLYTAGQPDPDLIIRTGGEMRLSNFLLWQASYSEYYSTPVLWPDFDEKCLDEAILEYNKRTRKFGGLSS